MRKQIDISAQQKRENANRTKQEKERDEIFSKIERESKNSSLLGYYYYGEKKSKRKDARRMRELGRLLEHLCYVCACEYRSSFFLARARAFVFFSFSSPFSENFKTLNSIAEKKISAHTRFTHKTHSSAHSRLKHTHTHTNTRTRERERERERERV